MDVRELIARCTSDRNDAEAWTTLYKLIESVALPAIRRVVFFRHAPTHLVEDILQELLLALLSRDWNPLLAFQGTCEPQLRGFLRVVAHRFATRMLHRWLQRQRREEAAAIEHPREPEGLTEHEMQTLWAELERIVADEDRPKLRAVSPDLPPQLWARVPTPDRMVSERTLFRWRSALYQKYAERIV